MTDELTSELVRLRSETHYGSDSRVDYTTTNIRVVVDSQGQVLSTNYTNAHETHYQYDAQGRSVKTIYSDDSFTAQTYDDYGRMLTQSYQTADGQTPLVKEFTYDDFGRLITVTLPEVYNPVTEQNVHPVYEYAYDEFGNQVAIIDPLGHETDFTYNDQGQEISRTLPIGVSTTGDPDDFIEEKFYDEDGRLDYAVSFEGVVTAYVYDDTAGSGGRLSEIRYFDDLKRGQRGHSTFSLVGGEKSR